MTRGLHSQGDGRRPLPHIVTGVLSVLLTLTLSHFAHLGGVGPAGAPGPAGKSAVTAGVCAYFGKDSSGTRRFQLSTPNADGTCAKGNFVSVVPGR